MSFEIREANVTDIAAITEIYADAVSNGVASYELSPPSEMDMRERFLASVGNHFPYTVAVDASGMVLGYAYASSFRPRAAYRWTVEDSVYLAPLARGKGIGKALLKDLMVRCTSLGFRQMVAVIGGASANSIALHKAVGFREVGRLQSTGYKQEQWLDTMLMQAALGETDRLPPDPAVYPGTLLKH